MSTEVDWDFARSVAEKIANREESYEHPAVGTMLDSDFAELTPQAEELVAAETGLVSKVGPARAQVTDRMGWVESNLASFDRLLRPLLGRLSEETDADADTQSEASKLLDTVTEALGPWGQRLRPTVDAIGGTVGGAVNGATSYIGPKVAGAEVGALLGWMSGRVLGQYDLLIVEDERPEDQDWVYYVGPNIAGLEKRFGFQPREFRLWIAIHECTHRAQFTGVPWLRPYFLSLVNELLDAVDPDPKKVMETVRDMVNDRRNGNGPSLSDGGLSMLLATPEQRIVLDKVTGLMSLLEGHGDITMDRAAGDLIPGQERFHKVLSERRKNMTGVSKLVLRLTGMEAKMAQYEEGENFVKAVEAAGGRELFDQVWVGPDNLPTIDEIRSPDLWIARMGVSSAA
ncbi:MAG: zinc-dependent metalloprotease [Acidimicrobiia bacterium]|nr:zinc-dependent metalloprotease [Acidimicrobiia bacterium]